MPKRKLTDDDVREIHQFDREGWSRYCNGSGWLRRDVRLAYGIASRTYFLDLCDGTAKSKVKD